MYACIYPDFFILSDLSKGRALDILHTRPINRSKINILGTSDITDIKDSLVVVVTIEVSEREFAEFDEEDIEKQVYTSNVKLLKDVSKAIKKHCPHAFVVVTTNPVDCMAKVLQDYANIPSHKICGMAGVLHSARLRHNLAEKLRVKNNIHIKINNCIYLIYFSLKRNG